ncbi:hypothetical protein Y032_0265g671 [Ancylostoma ceylanicum]|uniref:Uncharacterized protein n=1 Tax=Ancylostoma ceylanicum TaxID=53326 RepID=A0A016SA99_9BILA|nr:hypothetical protein Y032_0265g671 [Ancylostoma ceylanicum]
MRICFDKGAKWCESEGSALNLLFVHDVFIPTDSDQAVMFGIPREQIASFNINFLMKEPAIELGYGYNFAMKHIMHLKVYEEVGFDPSKLTIHVIKSKHCRARVLNKPPKTQI